MVYKTMEEVEQTSKKLTQKELDKLHREYLNPNVDNYESSISSQDTDTNSDNDNDSDNQTQKQEYILSKKKSHSKQTTMLYMFQKYELLQSECSNYKNKLYKMRLKLHKHEHKIHYQNLQYSNLSLEKEKLKDDLILKRYIYIKYYISILMNVMLTCFLLYNNKNNIIQF
jgi:hypothetical protein